MDNKLLLSSHKKSWQVSSNHGKVDGLKNVKPKSVYLKVLERDKHTCYFCKFQSSKYQEIHHLNDDHDDDSIDNLVTICPLCHQSFHLNVAYMTNGGTIIWLPEFTQQELNHLLRAIFVAMDTPVEEAKDVKFHKMALSIYQSLETRQQYIDQYFYTGTNVESNERNVGAFGQMLLNLSQEEYLNRESFIEPFKILATPNRFPIQTKYWRKSTFQDIPITTWSKLINDNDIKE